MTRKLTAALAAATLLVAGPALAQAKPAARPIAAPAAESVSDANELAGQRGLMTYVLGAIVIGLVIYGIIELTDSNGDDEPVSP